MSRPWGNLEGDDAACWLKQWQAAVGVGETVWAPQDFTHRLTGDQVLCVVTHAYDDYLILKVLKTVERAISSAKKLDGSWIEDQPLASKSRGQVDGQG